MLVFQRDAPTIDTSQKEQNAMSPRIRTIHLLLAVQSIVIVFASINRLSSLTLGYVTANEFLRWVDFINMIPLPIVSLIAFYLLKKHIEAGQSARWGLMLGIVFILGVYLLGASYGDHEVTNYLHARFCAEDQTSDLCRIVIFNDDEFSHWLFFIGFVMVNGALLLLQALYPYPESLTRGDMVLLIVNGLFIGAGIVANLAFEEIGLDLYVVVALAALSLYLLWRKRRQPLVVYYSTAYTAGLIVTVIIKLVRG
jgi:hypothetical protein